MVVFVTRRYEKSQKGNLCSKWKIRTVLGRFRNAALRKHMCIFHLLLLLFQFNFCFFIFFLNEAGEERREERGREERREGEKREESPLFLFCRNKREERSSFF